MPGETIVVLPTYNERENITAVVEGVLARGGGLEALVVDDESPDGTAEEVRKKFGGDPRVHLMVRHGPRGRGYAGVAGFRWGVERGYKYLVEMDADGSHNPEYLPDIVAALESADVVICSRLTAGGGERGRGTARRWITVAANMYLRNVLGLKVRDCTSGYRGFRREVMEIVPWESVSAAGPSIVQEVLYVAAVNKFRIVEIPFVFEERAAGRSKFNAKILAAGLIDAVRIRKKHGSRS